MSDDEYDDELPPITVNSSFSRETQKLLRMPTAEELASQRAREAECERELLALRASDNEAQLPTDSSGSESEAAVVAAVTALRVASGDRPAPPSLADLLTPMLSRLPQDYAPVALLDSLREATPATLDTLTHDVCEATVSDQLEGSAELACAATWLCAASAGGGRELRRRSRRALHRVLEHGHFADPNGEASCALKAAVLGGELDASTYLELADAAAAASAAAPEAGWFHRRLLLAAIATLLKCEPPEESEESCPCEWLASSVSSAWATLSAQESGVCVRAAGRLVRACGSAAACEGLRTRLLAVLATAPPGGTKAQPDRLEVLVAAQKLQLLFREL